MFSSSSLSTNPFVVVAGEVLCISVQWDDADDLTYACRHLYRSRVAGIEMDDLQDILQDLWSLGWPEDQMSYLRSQIATYQGAYSEVWKESFPGRIRWEEEEVQDSVTDRIWKRHGWNRFDSGFGPFRGDVDIK